MTASTPDPPGGPVPRGACDVLCVGEAMAVLTPAGDLPVRDAALFTRSVGGAEFNAALTLAQLGVATAWLSRVGADGFGDHLLDVARAAGVLVDAVERDEERPTGLYVKARGTGPDGTPRSRMHYYRSGSAASALSPASIDRPGVRRLLEGARVVHVSGITPALSASSADAVAVLARRVADLPGTLLSVDLNFRPPLWRGRSTAALEQLLAAADEVLLGADEARDLLGTDDPLRLAQALPRARRLVLKREAAGVQVVQGGAVVADVPALAVRVVEPVGAGDAFAAGYLAATCHGLGLVPAVRAGHVCAALTLGVLQDRPAALPPWPDLLALVSVDDATWASTSVPDLIPTDPIPSDPIPSDPIPSER